MAAEQYCLRWNNFQSNIVSNFELLKSNEELVDVTISCEGRDIKAHKLLLSACSSYFKRVFKENPCPHPIVILQGVSYEDISSLLTFVYQGEVHVAQDLLESFLRTAELLRIRGLAGIAHPDNISGSDKSVKLKQDKKEIPTSSVPSCVLEVSSFPTQSSILPPTESSILPPTQSSILPPTESSILPPTESSLLPPTESSILPPTESSILPPTESSILPPTQSSILPPTQSSIIPPTQSSMLPPTQSSILPPTQSSPPPPTSPAQNDSIVKQSIHVPSQAPHQNTITTVSDSREKEKIVIDVCCVDNDNQRAGDETSMFGKDDQPGNVALLKLDPDERENIAKEDDGERTMSSMDWNAIPASGSDSMGQTMASMGQGYHPPETLTSYIPAAGTHPGSNAGSSRNHKKGKVTKKKVAKRLNSIDSAVTDINKISTECFICHQSFSNSFNMKRHFDRIHLPARVECPFCFGKFSSEKYLISHMTSFHPEGTKLEEAPEAIVDESFPSEDKSVL